MPKAAAPISLSSTQRAELQKLVRAARSPQQVVLRARIVLRCADGEDNTANCQRAADRGQYRGQVARTLCSRGSGGLADAARSGRPARLAAEVGERVRSEEHTSELQSQSNLVCRL